MTSENKNSDALDRAIAALREDAPHEKEVRAASERLWSRMQSDLSDTGEQIRGCAEVERLLPAFAAGRLAPARALLIENHLRECVACRRLAHAAPKQDTAWTPVVPAASLWRFRQFAMAATIVAVLGLSAYLMMQWSFAAPAGMRAKVQAAEGGIYLVAANSERMLRPGDEVAEGQLLRTAGGAHAFVQLRDGSVVELNERTAFSVNMRRKDTTIHLDQGRIIVQAAKRRTGHLYVSTADARVAVTGTVFSVNAGMKGSRVSVIEGEVHVAHAGADNVLRAGDQVATSATLSPVPVRDEIAWSKNLDKHLALLAQFAKLQHKFEQIPTPGLRYSSAILTHIPANAMVYASMPNLGSALNEANRILQEQLQQSAVLREWWNKDKHRKDGGLTFEQMVEKVYTLSRYLGDEVALVVAPVPGGEPDAVVIAEARRAGIGEYLQSAFSNRSADGEQGGIRVVDQAQLAALPVKPKHGELLALVRPDFVLFSSNPRALQRMNAQVGGGFLNTEFGQTVNKVYAHGAGFMLAANLQQLMAQGNMKPGKNPQRGQQSKQQFALTGFGDARFLIAEHRDLSGVPDNRAVLDFTGQRHGIASWLATPAPMGSLEYVSANAGGAVSFVSKSPAMMMDDLMQIAALDSHPHDGLGELEAKLGINLRDDFAACFGGDVTFALDGPLLPTPSWKVVAQVNDPGRLQSTLERLLEAVNREVAQHGRQGLQLQRNELNGRTFYTVRALDRKAMNAEVHYTFADGYMIAAPSRALVMNALRTKANNDSLAHSAAFQALLPRDQHANFSALFYQNLAPVIDPIASQLSGSQLQALREIAAEAKPTVICAYGEESSIEVASASRLFPFDLNRMAISTLTGGRERKR